MSRRWATLTVLGALLLALGIWRMAQPPALAQFFDDGVHRWSGQLDRWARDYGVDRDLLATVMQIESCGAPTVVSPSGAQGLFQVMPYHFAEGESMTDPETNARRGAAYLRQCLTASDQVIGAALACYNGGPVTLGQKRADWTPEAQSYFRWGVGIYSDARSGNSRSETMERWLRAGGSRLCDIARRDI